MEKARRANKKTIVIACVGLALIACIAILMFIQIQKPYAIVIGDKEVVLVEEKEDAEKVVRNVLESYVADDVDITSLEISRGIDLEKKNLWEKTEKEDVKSPDEAVRYIVSENRDDSLFTATITGKVTTEEDYTPEVEYKKDKDMFIGETRSEGETEEGKQLVTREVTVVNGEVEEEEVTNEQVIDEGETEVVYKGVKGLPEGEDWKTYDGEPRFYNGEDLMDYAKTFVGVTPYVRGGVSLKTGADCVGFVRCIYKYYGVSLSSHLKREGKSVSSSDMKPGDIICFSHHYAMYVGNGKMVHAANPSKDVCVEKVHGGIIGVRRIIN